MSGPYAVAAVTKMLCTVIQRALGSHSELQTLGNVDPVGALPPNRIKVDSSEPNRLNLFLFQVSPNSAWRNEVLATRDTRGDRVANTPLAIDLHYLLTAYGTDDFSADFLLGIGMQALHETPGLGRDAIRNLLQGAAIPKPFDKLTAGDLAEQFEQIKISPQYLSMEEMSKIWTALQANYRSSMAYHVSVVLIESKKPQRVPLPVLRWKSDDHGVRVVPSVLPPIATLTDIKLPKIHADAPVPKPGAEPDDIVVAQGRQFGKDAADIGKVWLRHPRMKDPVEATLVDPASEAERGFKIPSSVPAGLLSAYLDVKFTESDGTVRSYTTPECPIPRVARLKKIVQPATLPAPAGNIAVEIECQPDVRKEQRVSLLFGVREVGVESASWGTGQTTGTLKFHVKDAVAGSYPLRLRIDGTESSPFVWKSQGLQPNEPPHLVFDDKQVIAVT